MLQIPSCKGDWESQYLEFSSPVTGGRFFSAQKPIM